MKIIVAIDSLKGSLTGLESVVKEEFIAPERSGRALCPLFLQL